MTILLGINVGRRDTGAGRAQRLVVMVQLVHYRQAGGRLCHGGAVQRGQQVGQRGVGADNWRGEQTSIRQVVTRLTAPRQGRALCR